MMADIRKLLNKIHDENSYVGYRIQAKNLLKELGPHLAEALLEAEDTLGALLDGDTYASGDEICIPCDNSDLAIDLLEECRVTLDKIRKLIGGA